MRSLYIAIIIVIGSVFIVLDSNYAGAITSNTTEIISKQGNETGATTIQITNDSNSIVVVDPKSDPSLSSSIVLGFDSLPVIAYYDASSDQLKVVHCGNTSCSIGNAISTLVSESLILHQLDLAIGSDGFPIIGYQDFSGHLKVLHCGSVDCSQGNTLTVVDPNENVGQFLSLTIDSDGLPIMSYYDYPNQHLKIAYCSRIDCTEGNYVRTLDSNEYGGVSTSIAIGKDGFPVIAFSGLPIEIPKIIHCLTVICAKTTVTLINQSMTTAAYPRSMAIGKDGLPVVSYYGGPTGGSTFNLKVLRCGNPDCSTENTLTTVDPSPDSGQRNLMVMDKNGLPTIAYLVTNPYGFKIVHCGNSQCSAGNTWSTTNFTYLSDYSSMVLDKYGSPIITGISNSGGSLIVIHCGKADCSNNNQPAPQLRENLDNTHADLWYIGEAAKQNMYVKYSIQDNYTNNGNPYEMTIYFKEYNSDKKYWDTQVFVVYNSKIITGTFHLADDNLAVLENSDIPNEMKPYKDSYFRTLDSLLNVARKPGQSLSASWWCPFGLTISCVLKAEPDMEYENVPGGTFLCKVLTYKQYATYVNQDMPYPIKTGIGTGSMYKYELLEVGDGYPKIPEFPFAVPVLCIGIMSTIVFYRMKFRQ